MAILTAINGVARKYTPYVYQNELYLAREGAGTKGCSMSLCIYFGEGGQTKRMLDKTVLSWGTYIFILKYIL